MLGVAISRTKSIPLDQWTDEQVAVGTQGYLEILYKFSKLKYDVIFLYLCLKPSDADKSHTIGHKLLSLWMAQPEIIRKYLVKFAFIYMTAASDADWGVYEQL